MHALKLTQIGNSVGVILPKEVLARLKLEKGDTALRDREAPTALRMTPLDPVFETQLEVGTRVHAKVPATPCSASWPSRGRHGCQPDLASGSTAACGPGGA